MAKITFLGAQILEIVVGPALVLVVLFWIRWRKSIPKGLRLPPGPRGWPIAGNVADMPKQQEWKTFARWAKEHGDLVYIDLLGRPMISVNSTTVAHDLFDSRSSIYSDRCEFPMMNLMGTDWFFGIMHYGERWRWHRKLFHQYFSPTAATGYRGIERKHTRILLRKLHDSPKEFVRHLRHFIGANILEIVYGIKALPVNDPYIATAEKSMHAAAEAGNPGTFFVDAIPALRYVPEWVPGASFRKKARIWRQIITRAPVVPFEAVKKAIRSGSATPSVATSMIETGYDRKDSPLNYEEGICNTAGAAYTAGADTTVAALSIFMLAMLLHPDVQQKAQKELDEVLGDRLPDFDDRGNLPYTNAVCKEVYRWHPVGPLGVAHAVTQDDVYGDYFIPAGSIVFGNAWVMLHDEKTFGPNPGEFNPSRFLQPDVPDPLIAFGFGRRICPGRHVADDTVFLAVASILKMYRISLMKNSEGKEIPVEAKFTSGFISHPEPFVCDINIRPAITQGLLAECPRE